MAVSGQATQVACPAITVSAVGNFTYNYTVPMNSYCVVNITTSGAGLAVCAAFVANSTATTLYELQADLGFNGNYKNGTSAASMVLATSDVAAANNVSTNGAVLLWNTATSGNAIMVSSYIAVAAASTNTIFTAVKSAAV